MNTAQRITIVIYALAIGFVSTWVPWKLARSTPRVTTDNAVYERKDIRNGMMVGTALLNKTTGDMWIWRTSLIQNPPAGTPSKRLAFTPEVRMLSKSEWDIEQDTVSFGEDQSVLQQFDYALNLGYAPLWSPPQTSFGSAMLGYMPWYRRRKTQESAALGKGKERGFGEWPLAPLAPQVDFPRLGAELAGITLFFGAIVLVVGPRRTSREVAAKSQT